LGQVIKKGSGDKKEISKAFDKIAITKFQIGSDRRKKFNSPLIRVLGAWFEG
jgi:hypothetical protein